MPSGLPSARPERATAPAVLAVERADASATPALASAKSGMITKALSAVQRVLEPQQRRGDAVARRLQSRAAPPAGPCW